MNQDSEEHLNDEYLSFGEFVTLMWTIEADKEKKEALFAGASTKFPDMATYSKSINKGPYGDTLRQTSLDQHADEISALGSDVANIDVGVRKLEDGSMVNTQTNNMGKNVLTQKNRDVKASMLTPGHTIEHDDYSDSKVPKNRMANTIDVHGVTPSGKSRLRKDLGKRNKSTLAKQMWGKVSKIPTSVNSSIAFLSNHEAAGDPMGLHIEYGEMLPKVGVK